MFKWNSGKVEAGERDRSETRGKMCLAFENLDRNIKNVSFTF